MRQFLQILILTSPLLLISCSHLVPNAIKNSDKHYLAAKSVPPLRIPPGIASSTFHNYYPVSDHYYPESAKNVSLTPPGLDG